METFLIRALQLIMSLSLLVIIHEGGHFLFARLFKVRVEKFCLFFDPWFTLFKFKPKKSDTEYAVGWLPLGGYVKIAGMIDESMDTEQMKQPEQPWEFRSKPAWQRLLIMVGGVLFNFLLALFIYSMILFAWGDQHIKVQEAPLGMDFNETAKSVGFQDGDILLSADGVPFERYDGDMLSQIADAREVSVIRNGAKASVYIPEDLMQRLLADSIRFASYRFPYVIDSVMVNSPAAQAGIQPGDSIIALNGTPISFSDFKEAMAERKKTRNPAQDSIDPRLITLTYVRGGVTDTLNMRVDSAYLMGVTACLVTDRLLPMVEKRIYFLRILPGRCLPRRKDPERICRKHEIPLLERRSQTARWLRNDRQHLPCYMGLAPVLVYDSLPFHHSGFHEYPPYPRIGRRPRALPLLRDDSSPQTERQIYGIRSNDRYDSTLRSVDMG